MAQFNSDLSKTKALEDLKVIANTRSASSVEKEFVELDRMLEDDEPVYWKAETKVMIDRLIGDSHKHSTKRSRLAAKSNTQVVVLSSDDDQLEDELADTAQSADPALSAPSPPEPEFSPTYESPWHSSPTRSFQWRGRRTWKIPKLLRILQLAHQWKML